MQPSRRITFLIALRNRGRPNSLAARTLPLPRLFWDGLFVSFLQFLFCLMIKFLIFADRLSRLLPKLISAANDIHFSGSLHFKLLKPFASETSARREPGDCHATR